MDIDYRIGDLLAAEERVLLHGCNARGVMGSGVAKAIRAAYPEAFRGYLEAFERGGLRLGSVIWTTCPERIIGNAITQANYGRQNRVYVDYTAVGAAIAEADRFAEATQTGAIAWPWLGAVRRIAMPKLGAGLGGGDWNRIAAIIADTSRHFTPVVYSLA